ncbi:STAS domain-containing protein [Polyangium aurulentum]|uniref:STAS domain-containing protein n=1 Tax=Polyangium aurulentum TaxID=2567896 RepID=UPI0010ADAB57|nr:STAS domain-containing protein [Polyangium aurulentum]UQA59456.1 PAS domain-containing protein [Polyangium aurulentum]
MLYPTIGQLPDGVEMTSATKVDRFYNAFLEHPEALVVASLEGEILELNDAARRVLGPAVVPGAPLSGCIDPDDRGQFLGAWARLDGASEPLRFEARLGNASGEARPCAFSARKCTSQPEVYLCLMPQRVEPPAVTDDATRSGSIQPYTQEGRILRALLDNLNIVVWTMDPGGTITFHDGNGGRAVGVEPGSIVGKNMFDIFSGSQVLHEVLAGKGELHQLVQNGNVFYATWYVPMRDAHGKVISLIGLSLDVTEHERTKAELVAKLELIERQQEVIRNLETPIIQVWDRVLTLPMIGVVDSGRAARLMDALLSAITRMQARFAILDMTGVDVVDTATANHLIAMVRAVRLLGSEGIITGIRPEVAQTVVSLGLDLSTIVTLASLRDGLSLAIRSMAGEKGSPRAARRPQ